MLLLSLKLIMYPPFLHCKTLLLKTGIIPFQELSAARQESSAAQAALDHQFGTLGLGAHSDTSNWHPSLGTQQAPEHGRKVKGPTFTRSWCLEHLRSIIMPLAKA